MIPFPYMSREEIELEREVRMLSLKTQAKILKEFLDGKATSPPDYAALWSRAITDK